MIWRKLNLNDTVKVKLKDNGVEILRQRHDELYRFVKARGGEIREFVPPQVDAEGYSRDQLWHLFEAFGPYINLSCNPPFETTILVEVDE